MKFSSNTTDLRKWLLMRKASLEQVRSPYESLWMTLRENFEPTLGHALKGDIDDATDAALRDDEKLFDSKPRLCVQRMAAGLQSGITNQAREWCSLVPVSKDDMDNNDVRKYFGELTSTMHQVLARSNFYKSLDRIYKHLAVFGTACMIMVPDDSRVLKCIVIDTGAFWISSTTGDRVDVMLRRIRMTAAQMRREFGTDVLPASAQNSLNSGKEEQTYTVWNLICPTFDCNNNKDAETRHQWSSFYWSDESSETDGILAIRGYSYNPIIAPRWCVNNDAPYGCGQGQVGLADAKELQEIELSKMRLVEQASNPAMAAPQSMKGLPLDTGPGGIVYYSPLETGGAGIPVQPLFQTHQAIEGIMQTKQELYTRLDEIFYTDLFAMLLNLQRGGDPRTATEIQELASEKASLISPILSQLNDDLLTPIVESTFAIMYERAAEEQKVQGYDPLGIADMPQMESDEIDIRFSSTIHRQQEVTAKLVIPMRQLEMFSNIMQVSQDPAIRDEIDFSKMTRTSLGVLDDFGILRNPHEVETIREARQQMQMQQMQMQQAREQAEISATEARSVADMTQARLTTDKNASDLIEAQAMMM